MKLGKYKAKFKLDQHTRELQVELIKETDKSFLFKIKKYVILGKRLKPKGTAYEIKWIPKKRVYKMKRLK